jgi:hypothetical protein
VDWEFLEERFGEVYTDDPGHPPLPTRLMVGSPSSSTPTTSPTRRFQPRSPCALTPRFRFPRRATLSLLCRNHIKGPRHDSNLQCTCRRAGIRSAEARG